MFVRSIIPCSQLPYPFDSFVSLLASVWVTIDISFRSIPLAYFSYVFPRHERRNAQSANKPTNQQCQTPNNTNTNTNTNPDCRSCLFLISCASLFPCALVPSYYIGQQTKTPLRLCVFDGVSRFVHANSFSTYISHANYLSFPSHPIPSAFFYLPTPDCCLCFPLWCEHFNVTFILWCWLVRWTGLFHFPGYGSICYFFCLACYCLFVPIFNKVFWE